MAAHRGRDGGESVPPKSTPARASPICRCFSAIRPRLWSASSVTTTGRSRSRRMASSPSTISSPASPTKQSVGRPDPSAAPVASGRAQPHRAEAGRLQQLPRTVAGPHLAEQDAMRAGIRRRDGAGRRGRPQDREDGMRSPASVTGERLAEAAADSLRLALGQTSGRVGGSAAASLSRMAGTSPSSSSEAPCMPWVIASATMSMTGVRPGTDDASPGASRSDRSPRAGSDPRARSAGGRSRRPSVTGRCRRRPADGLPARSPWPCRS